MSSISSAERIAISELKIFLATINTIRVVVDVLGAFLPEELLILIINDEFLETAALFFTVQYKRGRFVLRFRIVQIEAVVWLHGSEFRLLSASSPGKAIRNSVAVLNGNIEVDIRVKRDRLTTER
jgi:hypothetical protein